jgi:hypothetical protein
LDSKSPCYSRRGDVDGAEHAANNLAEKIKGYIDRVTDQYEYKPLPKLPSAEPCDACNGSGEQDSSSCNDCDGEGEFQHGDYIYECQRCQGTGIADYPYNITCKKCRGSGCKEDQVMQIDGWNFNGIYLRLIADLPGAMIAVGQPPEGIGATEALLLIHYDYGVGVLMGMLTLGRKHG